MNVKFETLTYQAPVADFSVECASGPQEARDLEPEMAPKTTACPARISDVVLSFWLWMSGYVASCLFGLSLRDKSLGQQIVFWPVLRDGSETLCALRVSRSIARRLRRLARRGPRQEGFSLLGFQASSNTDHLSPAQCLEWLIRVYRIGRTRVYGLNATRRDLMRRAVKGAELQGDALCLGKGALCAAPLCPD